MQRKIKVRFERVFTYNVSEGSWEDAREAAVEYARHELRLLPVIAHEGELAALTGSEFDPKREIAIRWAVEDVQDVRPDLWDDEAMEVLEKAYENYDSTVGFSWQNITDAAEELYPEPKEEEE